MNDAETPISPENSNPLPTERILPPEARRALAEAEERRRAAKQADDAASKEIGGRKGPDPIRFGDWEVSGIASDF